MFCKNCGAQMNDNQAICVRCGTKTGDGTAFCPNCGQQVMPGAEFCMNCGVSLKSTDKVGNYDKITIALLAFFLGGIGVHNFVLGETKKGIFKIVMSCCFGIGAILALIDFVRILTDKYVVDPDKIF